MILFKRLLFWLLSFVVVVFIFGLVLSFLPSPLKVHHQGILPEKAAELRADFSGLHHTFATSEDMLGINCPLFNYKYTLRFLTMLDVTQLRIPESFVAPVLVGVGDEDEMFDVDKVRDFYDLIPGNNKEFLIWEGAKHAEIEREHWEQIVGWLNRNFN